MNVSVYSENSDVAVTSYRVTMQVSSRYYSNATLSKISESEGVILHNTIFGELTAIRFIAEINPYRTNVENRVSS